MRIQRDIHPTRDEIIQHHVRNIALFHRRLVNQNGRFHRRAPGFEQCFRRRVGRIVVFFAAQLPQAETQWPQPDQIIEFEHRDFDLHRFAWRPRQHAGAVIEFQPFEFAESGAQWQ